MPTAADIRAKYPSLAGLDDDQVVDVLHSTQYPHAPRQWVADKLGVKPAPVPEPVQESSSALRRAVGDPAISLLKGAIDVPEMAVGLADIPTGGAVGKALENQGGDIGFRPKEAKEYLDQFYSPEQKKAFEAVNSAHGLGDTLAAVYHNPSVAAHSAIESVPGMLAGGVVGRGVRAVTAGRIGAETAGAIGEGVTAGGQQVEQTREETPDGLLTPEQVALTAGSGVADALISKLSGHLAHKLGIHDIQTVLAGGDDHVTKGLIRSVLQGAAQEGLLEELPQSVQEQVAQNMALGKPLDEGVDQAAVLGAVTGGAMGSGAQALGRAHSAQPAPVAPPPVEPPAAPPLGLPAPSGPTMYAFPDGSVATGDAARAAHEQEVFKLSMKPQPGDTVTSGSAPRAYGSHGTAQAIIDASGLGDNHIPARNTDGTWGIEAAGAPGSRMVVPGVYDTPPAPETPGDVLRASAPPVVGPTSRAAALSVEAGAQELDTDPGAHDAPAPITPQPLHPLTPEHEAALLDHANARTAQLAEAETGVPEQQVPPKTEGAEPTIIPAVAPRHLTPKEKAEQAFLEANGGNVIPLSHAYPADALVAQRAAAREATKAATPEQLAAVDPTQIQPGDVLHTVGQPFKSRQAANVALGRHPYRTTMQVTPVTGGFALRPAQASLVQAPPTVRGPDGSQRAVFDTKDAADTYLKGARKARANATTMSIEPMQMADGRWMLATPAERVASGVTPAPVSAPAPVTAAPQAAPTPVKETRHEEVQGNRQEKGQLSPPAAPAQVGAATLPRVKVSTLGGERFDMSRKIADNLGVTQDIERLSYEGKTAQQIGSELGTRLDVVRRNSAQDGAQGRGAEKEFVRQVRVTLGIPSLDDHAEYAAWRKQYEARRGAPDLRFKLGDLSEQPVERIQAMIDQAYEQAGPLSAMTAEQHAAFFDRVGALKDALFKRQALDAARAPVTQVSEAFPGFRQIPVGTTVLATHGLKYTEPTRGKVVGTKERRLGDKIYMLPVVDFGDGSERTLSPFDIKEVYAPRASREHLATEPDRVGATDRRFEKPSEHGVYGPFRPNEIDMEKTGGTFWNGDHPIGPLALNEVDLGDKLWTSNKPVPQRTISVEDAQRVVDRLVAGWRGAPKITVVDRSVDQSGMMANFKGRINLVSGEVHIVAGKHGSPEDVANTVIHEVLGHLGLRAAFGGKLVPILDQLAAARPDLMAAKARQYGYDLSNLEERRATADEVLAELAETAPKQGFVQRAIAAVRQWLRGAGLKLNVTDADIAGWLGAARRAIETGAPDRAMQRLDQARSAERLMPDTSTMRRKMDSAFSNWFGNSKVVDPSGKPLTVYHGTNESFSEFSTEMFGEGAGGSDHGDGFYFTDRPDAASQYADGTGGNVMPVYLSMKNPATNATMKLREVQDALDDGMGFKSVQDVLEGMGHDGIIITHKDGAREFVVWKPEQIKSAIGNSGAFDGRNPDIRARLAQPHLDAVRDMAVPITRVAGNFMGTGPGTVGVWNKTVGTMFHLAKTHPAFAPVFDSIQTFLNDVSYYANRAADYAPNILPKLESWRDLLKRPISGPDNKAIEAPIFQGTLAWTRDEAGKPVLMSEAQAAAAARHAADSQRAAQNTARKARQYAAYTVDQKRDHLSQHRLVSPEMVHAWNGMQQDAHERVVTQTFAKRVINSDQVESPSLKAGIVFTPEELKSLFKLNDRQIGLYNEFRTTVDHSLDSTGAALLVRYGGALITPEVRSEMLRAPTAAAASTVLTKHLEAIGKQDKVAGAQEIATKIDDLKAHGYAPLSRFGTHTLDVTNAAGDRVHFDLFESDADRQKALRAMKADPAFQGMTFRQGTLSTQQHKVLAGISPDTAELFGKMLGLRAEEGGESDAADRAFQEYLKITKGATSALKHLIHRKGVEGYSRDVGRVLATHVYSNARLTSTSLHGGEIDRAVVAIPQDQGQLKDIAVNLKQYVQEPAEEAAGLRGLLFAQYLGGSVASALVNASQPFVTTLPYLSQYGGLGAAGKHMKLAVQMMAKSKGGKTGDAQLDAALAVAADKGITAPQEVHQLRAQASGAHPLSTGDGTKLSDAWAEAKNLAAVGAVAWGKVFGTAEQFNRRLTYIAAYNLAREQKMADPAGFAEDAVASTQFLANKGNKPTWARGAVGATLFTFKQYSVSYLEMVQRMAMAGEPGSPERAAGRRAALYAIGALMIMAGADGLPFIEDIDDVIDGTMQRLGYNFSSKRKREEVIRNLFGADAGNFITNGVTGLPGAPIDVSGRLGMANLIPGTGFAVDKQDHTSDLAELFGPAGDLVKRGFQAVGQAGRGDLTGALTTIAPKAAQNIVKAIDMGQSGVYKQDSDGKKVVDTDFMDAVFKAIGFQPRDVKDKQDAAFAVQKMVAENQLKQTQVTHAAAIALANNDPEGVQAAKDEVRDWNTKNPDLPIRYSASAVRKQALEMKRDKDARIEKGAPKQIRETVRRQLAAEES